MAVVPDPSPPAPPSVSPPSAAKPPRPRHSPASRLLSLLAAVAAVMVGFGVGLFAGWQYQGDFAPPPAAEAQSADPAPPDVAAPPPAAAAAPPVQPAEPERWSVQVNAQPWAWIRIDGEEAGATPLLAPGLLGGPHEFEATFPDGRRERRVLVIGPDSRLVSFR